MTESFLHNLPYYKDISAHSLREQSNIVNKDTTKRINNILLKIDADYFLKKMKPIHIAIDQLQSETCKLNDKAHIWLKLLKGEDITRMPLRGGWRRP